MMPTFAVFGPENDVSGRRVNSATHSSTPHTTAARTAVRLFIGNEIAERDFGKCGSERPICRTDGGGDLAPISDYSI